MAAHDDGLVFEDDDAPPPRRWADDSDMPPKRKKKKKPPKSLARTALKPALGFAAALALLVAFGGLTYWVATSLTGSPALLPADLWQEQVLGDRFKVSLPGNPKRSTMDLGQGLFARVLLVAVDENTAFSAACTEGKFPPDRAALTVEELLDYPCDGSREVVRQMDPRLTELSRTPVSFEGCPGKQLVLKVPAGSGQMVSRVYYADGRLFIISLVGRGVTADNPNVKYLFDSFKSVPESERKVKPKAEVAAAPVAPPVPPPVVPPPPPPSPPKAVVDPTLPKLAAEFAVLPVGVRAGVLAMGFTPDGKALALGTSEGRAAWYDPDTGKPLTDAGRGGGIDREEVGAVVSPQGDRVAFYRHGGQLYYWERGERAETVLHPGRGGPAQWRAAFSPDGATLCTTHGDQVARIWDVAAGRVRGTVKPFAGQVASAAYSPDGELLACADTRAGVWDAKTLRKLGDLEPKGDYRFSELAFSPGGETLVGVRDRELFVWGLARDPEAETVVASTRALKNIEVLSGARFSPDGKLLLAVTDSGRVRAWDTATWKRRGDLNFSSRGVPSALAFRSGDGRLAVACGPSVLLLDLDGQKWD